MSAPATPTTKEIADNIVAQVGAAISQQVPFLPKTFIRVLAKALSGVYVILYKYGGFIFLQQFVRTASDKPLNVNGRTVTPLQEWGALVGLEAPKAAEQAELEVQVSVTSFSGSLPSSSQVVNPATGVVYLTVGSVLLDSPTVNVVVRAAADQQGGDGSGEIGNVPDGTVLQFANPLLNVSRDVVVTATNVTGADAESSDAYRQRILDRFQKRPQGGAYADYEQWGEEAAGVANVYPYTSDCPGQVDLYVESATEPDGIPTTAQLEAVLASVELDQNGLASRRPATALVNAFPIDRLQFDVEVIDLTVDNPPEVRDNIERAVDEYFLSREPYIIGLSVPPRKDRVSAASVTAAVEDVVSLAGGTIAGVNVTRDGAPVVLYTLGIGEKAKGVVTYV